MEKIEVGQKERKTQDRIINLFKNKLGYTYLGYWKEREGNSNIEEHLLRKFLKERYNENLTNKALHQIMKTSTQQNKNLYNLNKDVYQLLRYGIPIRENPGENKQTVKVIDWENPHKNNFYVAEEVIIKGKNTKIPDVVLYINGIAIGVIELKRSTVSVSEGIRQNIESQSDMFIKQFFSTMQIVMAGNDTEGLRYATIGTPEKYYLSWKEDLDEKNKLNKHIKALCNKERILEIIYDFIVFDSGIKKICRHNQYFGVKAAQKSLKNNEGGIIWHTQGSGKSLTMIWLARWIKENLNDSRVLVITDRHELDEQIEGFFRGAEEQIYRTKSGKDLIKKLGEKKPSLMCSLIHKFGGDSEQPDYDKFIEEVREKLPQDFEPQGNFYVFVDECHRTQSGKLHKAMKEVLPNATFVGFTGTPLLKKDKKKSIEVFGKYIHTYKYDEAVEDNVVLDLQYEAREIPQKISSQEKIDQWFQAKTRGLTDVAKRELKKKWGTMQKVLSSKTRLSKIVSDVLLDMETRHRLQSGKGNAMLIAGSIYEACRLYELFQEGGLKKCAIITSYDPNISSIKKESVSDEEETENLYKYKIYNDMVNYYESIYPEIKTKGFEDVIKDKFVNEPHQMKLLIVVDKLITGFDAPPATYLYIDKKMRDHGLFQAICRVNRLHTEDKEYGYIIDYKDLFKSLDKAVKTYTSEAFSGFEKGDVEGLLKNRLQKGKERLDSALESVRELCEPVKSPKDLNSFIDYFCGDTEKPKDLKNTERRRTTLYKLVSKLVRAYANLANDMYDAGYKKEEIKKIKKEVKHYEHIKSEIKLASGDNLDLKAYEPAMRHLIDSYIDSEESKTVSAFDDMSIVDLIIKQGKEGINNLPENMRKNKTTVAETIENNTRKLIIEEKPTNPKYYEKMSDLLDDLIRKRKEEEINYSRYLEKIEELIKKVKYTDKNNYYPKEINTNAKRALYDNLNQNEDLALEVHKNVMNFKPDGWRGNKIKEKKVTNAIRKAMKNFEINDEDEIKRILELVKNQNEY